MHEFIQTEDNILAATVSDRITGEDLTALMDRLEAILGRHQRIHVLVETRSIHGIEISQLPAYMARAMPLFGQLRRFDRVAVVADQAWVRMGTRVESALLPFISYRTFEPAQREEALAWVTGNTPPPAG